MYSRIQYCSYILRSITSISLIFSPRYFAISSSFSFYAHIYLLYSFHTFTLSSVLYYPSVGRNFLLFFSRFSSVYAYNTRPSSFFFSFSKNVTIFPSVLTFEMHANILDDDGKWVVIHYVPSFLSNEGHSFLNCGCIFSKMSFRDFRYYAIECLLVSNFGECV